MAKDGYIQALRGVAIAAVVLIHCLPDCGASVVARPFLNWSVAMFLFLSGILTSRQKIIKEKKGGVIRKRLIKIAVPYFIWSALYLVAKRPDTIFDAFWALLSGGASAQMYYLLVYAQLVALTPLFLRLLRVYRTLLYAVTPVVLLVWELLAASNIDSVRFGIFFPAWLIYYLFGLEWSKWSEFLRDRGRLVAIVAIAALVMQIAEGFAWNAYGDYNMATTQLRLTNMFSSMAVISLLMLVSPSVRRRISNRSPLVCLGDVSFGIYLCHIAVLKVFGKLFELVGAVDFLSSLLLWAVVLGVSAVFVVMCQRVLPERVLAAIGFV